MTESLRWGILATGGIARLFTGDLKANGFDVRAAGSRSQASADAFAAEFDVPTSYGELRGPRRRPRGRRHLHRVAASAPRGARDAGARGRQARAHREAVRPEPGAGRAGRRPRRRTRAAGPRGDVDPVPAAHGPHPRTHRLGRPRRSALRHRRSHPETARRPGAPHQCARTRRRCAARPRHLPGVLRVGYLRRTGDRAGLGHVQGDRCRRAGRHDLRLRGQPHGVVALGERHEGPEHRRRARQRGTHRDRLGLVHGDLVPPRLERRRRARGVHVRRERARHALTRRQPSSASSPSAASTAATGCRPPRASPSWARSTKSARRSGCATPASDAARLQIQVRTTAYNARVHDETDARATALRSQTPAPARR